MVTSPISTISLTEAAQTALRTTFQDRARPSLRIFMSFMYDGGPRLDVAPDAPNADDSVCQVDGWTVVINTQLLNQAAPLSIDVGPQGYVVHSALDFSEAGGDCGGTCDHH